MTIMQSKHLPPVKQLRHKCWARLSDTVPFKFKIIMAYVIAPKKISFYFWVCRVQKLMKLPVYFIAVSFLEYVHLSSWVSKRYKQQQLLCDKSLWEQWWLWYECKLQHGRAGNEEVCFQLYMVFTPRKLYFTLLKKINSFFQNRILIF